MHSISECGNGSKEKIQNNFSELFYKSSLTRKRQGKNKPPESEETSIQKKSGSLKKDKERRANENGKNNIAYLRISK